MTSTEHKTDFVEDLDFSVNCVTHPSVKAEWYLKSPCGCNLFICQNCYIHDNEYLEKAIFDGISITCELCDKEITEPTLAEFHKL